MTKVKFVFPLILLVLLLSVVNNSQPTPLAHSQPISPVPTPPYPVHPEDRHWLDKLQDLPYSAEPYEGAPAIRPDPSYGALSKEEVQKVAEQLRQTTQLVYSSGPETAGSKIMVLGKEIQLPPDIYVNAYISSILCDPIPDLHCPRTPIYVLYTLKEDAHVRVEATGEVYTFMRNSEVEIEHDRKTFQFVLDALGTELKIDTYQTETSE